MLLLAQARDYLESSEFQERRESTKRNLKDVELLTKSSKDKENKDISTARTIKERFAGIDTAEEVQLRKEADEMLVLALEHYLAVLRKGEGARSQAAVYRLVALWFANMESSVVVALLPPSLPTVPSHKFCPLLYQLAARMALPKPGVKDSLAALCALMLRCAHQHPHHTLPIALALTNAREDERLLGTKGGGDVVDPRGQAAAKLVALVEKREGLGRLVVRYKAVCQGLIHLAYVQAPAKSTSSIPFPRDQPLLKVILVHCTLYSCPPGEWLGRGGGAHRHPRSQARRRLLQGAGDRKVPAPVLHGGRHQRPQEDGLSGYGWQAEATAGQGQGRPEAGRCHGAGGYPATSTCSLGIWTAQPVAGSG